MAYSFEVPDENEIRQQVAQQLQPDEKMQNRIETAAEQQADTIINVDLGDLQQRRDFTGAVESLGSQAYDVSRSENTMLKKRMADLSHDSQSAQVANTLEELTLKMKDLDPSNIDFAKKGLFGKISNPVRRYFEKYKTADAEIDDILKSLDKSRKSLSADNTTLELEEVKMTNTAKKLQKDIETGMKIDDALQRAIEKEESNPSSPDSAQRVKFAKEEILFPLRQKVMDMQQMQVVSQQGIIAMEVIRRNNSELIRSVQRAQSVTVTSLTVAVTVAQGLYDQKIVLDKVNMLNNTTSNMISSTSRMLKEQGAEIQKQASESSVSVETMKNAFADTISALDDISKYRQEALPKMRSTIEEFQKLADEGQKRIDQMTSEEAQKKEYREKFEFRAD